MITFKIENLHPYNGDHPLDIEQGFTNRELHTIKEVSGVRANELEESLTAGDNDILVALVAIALKRQGLIVNMDAIWDAPAGAITVEADAEDGDAGPPDLMPPEPNGDGGGKPNTSGASSPNDSDPPANGPSPTGTPA